MATQLAPMLGFPIEGIWHTAVVVHGFEWYFGGGGGIVHSLPGTTELREPLRTVELGATDINLAQFQGGSIGLHSVCLPVCSCICGVTFQKNV